jgi:CRISPR-associated protein Cmr3
MNLVFEPRDPLVFRDGRPLGDGGDMKSVTFPWPSSIAGCLRTRLGTSAGSGFERDLIQRLLEVEVRGPLLVDLETKQLLVRAPADALWNEPEKRKDDELELRRLKPSSWPAGAKRGTAVGADDDLQLLGASGEAGGELPKGKAASGTPAFWHWSKFVDWLTKPPETMQPIKQPCEYGPSPLTRDLRTHVAIDPEKQSALDGALFRTEAVVFSSGQTRYGLSVQCDVPGGLAAQAKELAGYVTLGGEQRLTKLSTEGTAWPEVPKLRPSEGQLLRVVLLTPALFRQGWRPGDFALDGAELVAARVDRPEVISGWDYAKAGPKPVRRAAPAGSVYWVRLNAGINAESWIKSRWLQSISDDDQDRRDGFGLCAVGVG